MTINLKDSMASILRLPLSPAPQDPDRNRYQYQPLPTKSSFRIVELLPGNLEDDIRYKLHIAEIGLEKNYEALSYTWNNSNVQVATFCDGKILGVSPNLHAALKALRLSNTSIWIWADAISINQDDTSERSEQVKHMLDIYRNATLVTVWLGPDEKNELGESKAQQARLLIDYIAKELVKLTGHLLWSKPDQFSM